MIKNKSIKGRNGSVRNKQHTLNAVNVLTTQKDLNFSHENLPCSAVFYRYKKWLKFHSVNAQSDSDLPILKKLKNTHSYCAVVRVPCTRGLTHRKHENRQALDPLNPPLRLYTPYSFELGNKRITKRRLSRAFFACLQCVFRLLLLVWTRKLSELFHEIWLVCGLSLFYDLFTNSGADQRWRENGKVARAFIKSLSENAWRVD